MTIAFRLLVADEVWVATALLHREQPERLDFSLKEIERRLARLTPGDVRGGVYPHISLHCVANLPPNPGRYRMLFATAKSRRRLFRPGDVFHPDREGAKTTPAREDLPLNLQGLLDWYARAWPSLAAPDPFSSLRTKYRQLWKDTDADAFVSDLRKGWSTR